jgi:hypothetical protein
MSMKRKLIGLLAWTVMFGSLQAQEFPQAPTDLPHLMGADLFIDLAQYEGKQVVIIDGYVFGANNDGAFLRAGAVSFRVRTDGIDRETFRFFLKNCHGLGETPGCKVLLLATPTGKATSVSNSPELTGIKIVR